MCLHLLSGADFRLGMGQRFEFPLGERISELVDSTLAGLNTSLRK